MLIIIYKPIFATVHDSVCIILFLKFQSNIHKTHLNLVNLVSNGLLIIIYKPFVFLDLHSKYIQFSLFAQNHIMVMKNKRKLLTHAYR